MHALYPQRDITVQTMLLIIFFHSNVDSKNFNHKLKIKKTYLWVKMLCFQNYALQTFAVS